MKTKRIYLSKSIRFEVFKRDSFKCQYCGAAAPDVLLHVDHIDPVSKGGPQTDIVNLITACESCNLGKSDVPLSDDSVAAKRKAQLDDLQERREQLTMMADWQRGLMDLDEQAVTECSRLWRSIAVGYHLNESGTHLLRTHVKKWGMPLVMESMRAAAKYLETREEGGFAPESVHLAWQKIPAICVLKKREKDNPELAELHKIRAVMKKRIPGYFCDWEALEVLKTAVNWGVTPAQIWDRLNGVNSWSKFNLRLHELIEHAKEGSK